MLYPNTRNNVIQKQILGTSVDTQFREGEATALGWGVLTFHSPFRSCDLQQVQLPVISHSQCLMKSKYTSDLLPSTLFCAGLPQGGKDTCQVSSKLMICKQISYTTFRQSNQKTPLKVYSKLRRYRS